MRIRISSAFVVFALAVFLGARAVPALAQPPRDVAVLRTAALDPKLSRLAAAIDPVVLARLGERGVRIAAHPALDLSSVQLARDCVGETPQCLRIVTDDLGADALIVASLKRSGEETILTILYFDALSGEIRSAARQHGGPQVDRGILDDVRDVLHELLQPENASPPLPEAAAKVAVSEVQLGPAPPAPAQPIGDDVDEPGPPLLPIAVTAGGVLVGAGGIVFALLAADSRREFERAPTDSPEQIDAAYDKLSTAQEQAAIANIGLAVGGLATVAGIALFLLQPGERAREPEVAVTPRIGKGELALQVSGRSPVLSW